MYELVGHTCKGGPFAKKTMVYEQVGHKGKGIIYEQRVLGGGIPVDQSRCRGNSGQSRQYHWSSGRYGTR